MTIDRRTFILRTALFGTAAAVANSLSMSSTVQALASPLPGPLTTELIAGGMDRNCVVFKIDGWDRCDEKAIDDSTAALSDSVTNDPADDKVLIRINQSWRTTWR
jgi:hypothetical protein